MSGKPAYSEGAILIQQGKEIDSHWDLELQDTLLDVAAVVTGTEPARTVAPVQPMAGRLALSLHWTLLESPQRTN